MPESLRLLELWLEELRSLGGYRGLVVGHHVSPWLLASRLSKILADRLGGPVVCVAPREARGQLLGAGGCARVLSPAAIEELLGSEASSVVIAVGGLLRPNLVAAAAETVAAGGVAAVAAPPLEQWNPGGAMSRGLYKRYLLRSLERMRSLFWFSLDHDAVYAYRLPGGVAARPPPPGGVEPSTPGLPRRLLEAAANEEQARALDRAAGFLRGRGRSLLVTGDRGRGKSGLLGLVVAYLVKTGMAGFVSVTAPSPWSVQGFFRVLRRGLEAVGVRHWTVERRGVTIGVAGKWFHVRYHTPDQAQPGPYTVVDEAAALGPSRLRLLARRSPRLLAATTIHGYEGSGRVLARMVEDLLPAPRMVLRLETPVRYPPGDPLEEWVYDTFMLRVEAPEPPGELGEPMYMVERPERLVEQPQLLRALYGLLVEAHYRNEPDDLALLLDAPHHSIHVLYAKGVPVAVADAAWETGDTPWEARMLYDILEASAGPPGPGVRIVRIAVHPRLQRRGLGSRLLRSLEAWASGRGAAWTGAVFGRVDVLGFWLHNGYTPVYVSPLPNRVTGEHNLAVAKQLDGGSAVGAAAADLAARLLWASHSLYRSLPVETLAQLLQSLPAEAYRQTPGCRAEPSPGQARRLRLYLEGRLDAESILDVLTLLLHRLLCLRGAGWMGRDEALVAAGRLLQGRTMRELEPLLGGAEAYREALRRLAARLVGDTVFRGEGASQSPEHAGEP